MAEKSERDKYREFLTRVFSTLAFEGHYVIVGRGSQFILKGHPRAAHIMLVADHDSRVNFLLRHYDISRSEAEKIIREKERERAAIASKLFDADINDLNYYHMVLNTGLMAFETAADVATDFVKRFLKLWAGENGPAGQGSP